MTVALPLAGAALAPAEAEACSPDPCIFYDHWTELEPINAGAIPTDGALLLRGAKTGDGPDEDVLDRLDLTVTRDGQPIAGAIETAGVDHVLIWRPAEPLEPGATYKVTGTLFNDESDEYYELCGPELLQIDFEFHADLGPSAPLEPPEVSTSPYVQTREIVTLEDLVCCDGAMPEESYWNCGYGEEVYWTEGFCTSRLGYLRLRVDVTTKTNLPPATDAMVVRQLVLDGEPRGKQLNDSLTVSDIKPFCTAVRLTNIATGESIVSEETCHGADLVGKLGEQPLDPSPKLAEKCSSEAYVCEIDPESPPRWDPNRCQPWPGEAETTGDPTGGPTTDDPTTGGPGTGTGDGTGTGATDSGAGDDLVDHGCACDGGGASPLGLLALAGLGLLRPRRRRRRSWP